MGSSRPMQRKMLMVMRRDVRDHRAMLRWLATVLALTACAENSTHPATTATAQPTTTATPPPKASALPTASATAADGTSVADTRGPDLSGRPGLNSLPSYKTVLLMCGEQGDRQPGTTIYVEAPCADTTVTANGSARDEATLALSARAFRRCGDRALGYESKTVQGSARFDVAIDARGESTNIAVSERTGLTDKEVECVKKNLEAIAFETGPRALTVWFTQKIAPTKP